MPFLYEVSQHEADNKMSIANLALVFGPTLMPAPVNDMGAMVRDANTVNTIMMLLIENHEWLLAPDSEASSISDNSTEKKQEHNTQSNSATIKEQPQMSSSIKITDKTMTPTLSPPVAKKRPPKPTVKPLAGYAVGLHNYIGRNSSELSFTKGSRIIIYEKTDPNWWKGEVDGKKGYVAAAYVKEVKSEETQSSEEPVTPSTNTVTVRKVPPVVRPRTRSAAVKTIDDNTKTVLATKPEASKPSLGVEIRNLRNENYTNPPQAQKLDSSIQSEDVETEDDEDDSSLHQDQPSASNVDEKLIRDLSVSSHSLVSGATAHHTSDEKQNEQLSSQPLLSNQSQHVDEAAGYLDIGEIQERRQAAAELRTQSLQNTTTNQTDFESEELYAPPTPPVDYEDEKSNGDDDFDGDDSRTEISSFDDNYTDTLQPAHVLSRVTEQSSTPTTPATPLETPEPPNGGGASRLFEMRHSSKFSHTSRMSRALSFGPTFAPPLPPSLKPDEGDRSETVLPDLPPPPPELTDDSGSVARSTSGL